MTRVNKETKHTQNGVETDTGARVWELSRTEDVLRTITKRFATGEDEPGKDTIGRAREAARAVHQLLRWTDSQENRGVVREVRFEPRYAEEVTDLEVPVRVLCGHLNAVTRAAEPRRLHEGLRIATAAVVVQLEQVVELLATGVADRASDSTLEFFIQFSQTLAGLRIDNETAEAAFPSDVHDGADDLGRELSEAAEAGLKAANQWRRSSVALLFLIAGLAAAILFGSPLATGSLHADLARLSVTVPLAVLAGYMGRESSKHRNRAERAQDFGLHLLHLRSFSAPLAPQEKSRYRFELGQRALPGPDPPVPVDPASGMVEELARLTEVLRGQIGGEGTNPDGGSARAQ